MQDKSVSKWTHFHYIVLLPCINSQVATTSLSKKDVGKIENSKNLLILTLHAAVLRVVHHPNLSVHNPFFCECALDTVRLYLKTAAIITKTVLCSIQDIILPSIHYLYRFSVKECWSQTQLTSGRSPNCHMANTETNTHPNSHLGQFTVAS